MRVRANLLVQIRTSLVELRAERTSDFYAILQLGVVQGHLNAALQLQAIQSTEFIRLTSLAYNAFRQSCLTLPEARHAA